MLSGLLLIVPQDREEGSSYNRAHIALEGGGERSGGKGARI